MLIEMLELKGIHCVSANTDGILCLYPKSLRDIYMATCKEWEKIVGNSEQGMLEYEDYKVINQLSVSSYLAISLKGKVKKKKEFLTDYEINKNKSRRVVPLALEAYLKDGIPVEKFITEHKNIFDFCVGVKSSNNYHYELISPDGTKEVYNRLVRYIISKDGKKLMKIKNELSEATGADVSQCVADDDVDDTKWHCTILNTIKLDTPIEDYNINYDYYIRKVNKILNQIKGHKKNVIINPNQINMFE